MPICTRALKPGTGFPGQHPENRKQPGITLVLWFSVLSPSYRDLLKDISPRICSSVTSLSNYKMGKKKNEPKFCNFSAPPAAQPHSLLPAPACRSLGEAARPRSGPVSDASGGSDPEMSTLLPAAPDGNQVSCLMETLSDVLFTLSRDSKAPRPYSRSHVHLKKTLWNIIIWCRD